MVICNANNYLKSKKIVDQLRQSLLSTAVMVRLQGIDPDEALRVFADLLRGKTDDKEENRL